MEQFKKFCKKALSPHWLLILLFTALCGTGLAWVFLTGHETRWIAYPLYVLSFYTLTVLCIWAVPRIVKGVKAREEKGKTVTLADKKRRFRRSLIQGMVMNLVYALFQMIMGYFTRSAWTGSQGAYQLIMALIHVVLLYYDRKMEKEEDLQARWRTGWNGFQVCGIFLLILHLTMTGLVFQMVWKGETEHDNEILVIGVAAYTFYKLAMAIIRVVQYRKNASPLMGAARNIDLSEALMNLFTLQASLLSIFSTAGQEGFRFLMNTLFGGAVCLMAVGGAVGMITHGNKRKNETVGEI